MKKKLILPLLAIIFVCNSCGNKFEKLVKSNDNELKYEKALAYYEKKEYDKALVLLEDVLGVFRGSNKIETIYFYYAFCHFKQKEYLSAATYFKNFANTFPSSKFAEEANFMIGQSYYELSPNYRLDQTHSTEAIGAYQAFANNFPESNRVATCNKIIDELRLKLKTKAFEQAQLYYKISDFQAAAHTYKSFIADFPEASEIEQARFMIVKSYFQQASNTIEIKQKERFEQVVEAYTDFVEKHPKSKFSAEAASLEKFSVARIKKLN